MTNGAAVEVSVIVPVGPSTAHLGEQLDALATQSTDTAYEVVLVDNNPTSRGFDLPDERFRVVRALDRQGAAYARNVGARSALGRTLLFCDADDIVCHGWIEAMASAASRGLDVFGGPIDDRRLDPLHDRAPLTSRGTLALPRDLDFMPWFIGANIGLSASAWTAIDGWSEDYRASEEVDLCWRARQAGLRVGEASEALVLYRMRGDAYPAFRQGLSWGYTTPRLLLDHGRHGMRRPPLLAAVRDWVRLTRAVLYLNVSARDRRDWSRLAGLRLGRVIGSVRWRRLLL